MCCAVQFPQDDHLKRDLAADTNFFANDSDLHKFMLSLAVNNTVVPNVEDGERRSPVQTCHVVNWLRAASTFESHGMGTHLPPPLLACMVLMYSLCLPAVKHEAESPDEAALVAAAYVYNYVLQGRTSDR